MNVISASFSFMIRKNDGPHLIIAPNSTLQNWLNEINRFCPSLNGLILIGNKESRADILHRIKNQQDWDVCITSYEMLLIEATTLKRLRWKYVVIDEAHRIKNENTKLSKTLRKFSSENRLLLTGTPLQVSQEIFFSMKVSNKLSINLYLYQMHEKIVIHL